MSMECDPCIRLRVVILSQISKFYTATDLGKKGRFLSFYKMVTEVLCQYLTMENEHKLF